MYSFFFFKQKTAYEMRISDWSSDVCSSYLASSWPVRQAPTGSLRTPTAGSASPRHCRRDTAAARAPAMTGTGAWSADTRPVLRRPLPERLGRTASSVSRYSRRTAPLLRCEQVGRAHVLTPVTHAHIVCRLPL